MKAEGTGLAFEAIHNKTSQDRPSGAVLPRLFSQFQKSGVPLVRVACYHFATQLDSTARDTVAPFSAAIVAPGLRARAPNISEGCLVAAS
jgi:hypothetical protein